jgi:hypothetical protein
MLQSKGASIKSQSPDKLNFFFPNDRIEEEVKACLNRRDVGIKSYAN